MTTTQIQFTTSKLVEQAESVFKDKNKAQRWLNKPKVSLDGLTPLEAAKNGDASQELINTLLKNIENGYF